MPIKDLKKRVAYIEEKLNIEKSVKFTDPYLKEANKFLSRKFKSK